MYEMLLYNFALVFFCLFQNVLISSPTLVSDKQNVFWLRNDYSYSFKYQRRTKQISSKCPGESKIEKTNQLSYPHPIRSAIALPFAYRNPSAWKVCYWLWPLLAWKRKGTAVTLREWKELMLFLASWQCVPFWGGNNRWPTSCFLFLLVYK